MSDDNDCPCYECDRVRAAHRTAIDLVLAHLTKLHTTLVLSGATPVPLIATIMSNVIAMRTWTPEHAAEVLRETKAK